MAEKKSMTTTDGSDFGPTNYVVDTAPSLPDANVNTTRPDPVIDQRLLAIRDAEAKANADAVK